MPKGSNSRPAFVPDEFDIITGKIAVLLRSGYREKAAEQFEEALELSREVKDTPELRGNNGGRPCKRVL